MILNEWLAFCSAFFNIHGSGVLTVLFGCYMAGATWNCCYLGAFFVHQTTMYQVTSLHAKPQTYGAKPRTYGAVTCHLHFWHNNLDLLHATAVTWKLKFAMLWTVTILYSAVTHELTWYTLAEDHVKTTWHKSINQQDPKTLINSKWKQLLLFP